MVFEGIMPFCLPERWRRMIGRIAGMDNRSMHSSGLVSMLIGLSILVFCDKMRFWSRGHCDKYRRLVVTYDGIDDVLPEQAQLVESARRKLLDLYASWGYDDLSLLWSNLPSHF